MATYYASQAGAGLADGSSQDNAWSIATINWATVGGGGNTLCLLGTVTSTVSCAFGADGVAGSMTTIRGDDTSDPCTIEYSTSTGLSTNGKDYIEVRNIGFSGGSAANIGGVLITGSSNGCEIRHNTFTDGRMCIGLNGGDDNLIEHNTISPIKDFGGYGIRLYSAATSNIIRKNTFIGHTDSSTNLDLVFVSAASNSNEIYLNDVGFQFGGGIIVKASDSNKIWGNYIHDVGDCLALEDADSNEVTDNLIVQTGFKGTTFPALKLGNDFGAGLPADLNVIKNNIFVADVNLTNRIGILGGATQPMGANNVFDNNIWHHDGGVAATTKSFNYNNGGGANEYSWDQLQTAGEEANGYYQDPLLNDNKKPAQNSIAIGNGIVMGSGANREGFDGEPFSNIDRDIGYIQSTYSPFHPVNL
jgi:parallel beta-helix repeat protein